MINTRKRTIENVMIRLFNDIFSIAMNSHEIQFEMSRKIFEGDITNPQRSLQCSISNPCRGV